jgi:nucleoside-diphosphate-sugar epimerase
MKVLILGVNGFIGSHLVRRVLHDTDWELFGMDLGDDRVRDCQESKRFHFLEGDITITREWIEYHIKKCDVCLPLVAIATPATYVKDPLGVFALDFEENLRILRQCAASETRVIFPSTSEVYGMCPDTEFSEESSNLVYGPISKQRWIYACSKQLLDRVIWALGVQEGLEFTCIRPFNWIGPGLDNINIAKEGSSRVVTQFLGHILRGEPISLVDGGAQRRTFTYIDDGIDALMKILENVDGRCDGRIFNIGNPANDLSVRELAELMMDVFEEVTGRHVDRGCLTSVSGAAYYGKSYEDMQRRVPAIGLAREILGWSPQVPIREALRRTIAFYVATPGAQGI